MTAYDRYISIMTKSSNWERRRESIGNLYNKGNYRYANDDILEYPSAIWDSTPKAYNLAREAEKLEKLLPKRDVGDRFLGYKDTKGNTVIRPYPYNHIDGIEELRNLKVVNPSLDRVHQVIYFADSQPREHISTSAMVINDPKSHIVDEVKGYASEYARGQIPGYVAPLEMGVGAGLGLGLSKLIEKRRKEKVKNINRDIGMTIGGAILGRIARPASRYIHSKKLGPIVDEINSVV